MKRPKFKVELFQRLSDEEWSTVPLDVTNLVSMDVRAGIETTKDTFNFTTFNFKKNFEWQRFVGKKSLGDNYFRSGDNVKIYAWYDTQPTDIDDALLIFGTINNLDYSIDEEGNTYSVRGANRSEELLSTMIPATTWDTGTYNTAPKMIKQIVNRINKFNKNKKLYAFLDNEYVSDLNVEPNITNLTGNYGSIQTQRKSGDGANTDFPAIVYAEDWASGYSQIEKLSTTDYTGSDHKDGTYIFYMKNTKVLPQYYNSVGRVINELVWKSKTISTSGSYIEGNNISTMRITKEVSATDIKNALIINCGTDLKGRGITSLAYNADSMGKIGAKWGYYLARKNFSALMNEEVNSAGSINVIESNGYPTSVHNGDTWTFHFNGRNSNGTTTGSSATANTENSWNDIIHNEAKWRGTDEGQNLVDELGEPRFSASCEMLTGSNDFLPGGLYQVQSKSYGWEGNIANPSYLLRLRDWTHAITTSGWNTTLKLEEDERTISEQLNK